MTLRLLQHFFYFLLPLIISLPSLKPYHTSVHYDGGLLSDKEKLCKVEMAPDMKNAPESSFCFPNEGRIFNFQLSFLWDMAFVNISKVCHLLSLAKLIVLSCFICGRRE